MKIYIKYVLAVRLELLEMWCCEILVANGVCVCVCVWGGKYIDIYGCTPEQCKLSFFIRNIRPKFCACDDYNNNDDEDNDDDEDDDDGAKIKPSKRMNETLKLKLNLAIILCFGTQGTDKMLKLYCLTFQNIFLFMRLSTQQHPTKSTKMVE